MDFAVLSSSNPDNSQGYGNTVHLTSKAELVVAARPEGTKQAAALASRNVRRQAAATAAASGSEQPDDDAAAEAAATPPPPALPIRALKPGALVQSRVLRVVDNGLVVAFLHQSATGSKGLVGVIDQNHLAVPCKQEHWCVLFYAAFLCLRLYFFLG